MTIDYSTKGKVKFTMIDYIKGMLDELPVDMEGTVTTPALSHLFEVNNDAEKLSNTMSEMFHHNTAKLLFLRKRARPDIQPSVEPDTMHTATHLRCCNKRSRKDRRAQDTV